MRRTTILLALTLCFAAAGIAPSGAATPVAPSLLGPIAAPLGCRPGCLPTADRADVPIDIAVAPGGREVYAAVRTWERGGRVQVLSRDPATGTLTARSGPGACFAATATAGCARARGLVSPARVALSPDGRQLYVLSENPAIRRRHRWITDWGREAVVVFDRDPATGALRQPPGVRGCVSETGRRPGITRYGCAPAWNVDRASDLSVAPDGRQIYLASEGLDVAVLHRDRRTGALSPEPGRRACLSAYLAPQCVSTGRPTREMTVTSVTPSPDGRLLAVWGEVGVALLARDPASGRIRAIRGACRSAAADPDYAMPGCRALRGMGDALDAVAFSPRGRELYVASESGTVAVLLVDGRTHRLRQPSGRSGCLAPSRACLPLRHVPDDGAAATDALLMAPGGRDLVLVGRDVLVQLRRDPRTGLLHEPASACVGGQRRCPELSPSGSLGGGAVSPDGRDIYLGAREAGAVVGVRRLAPQAMLRQEAGGCVGLLVATACGRRVPLLENARSITAAPDGRGLYVTTSDRVVVLRRDPDSGDVWAPAGSARCIGPVRNGCARARPALDAPDVAVSGDARFVYMADGETLATFRRDPGSGGLEQIGALRAGTCGSGCTLAMDPGSTLALSADGRSVYTATTSRITTFRRDPETGALQPLGGTAGCLEPEPVSDPGEPAECARYRGPDDITLLTVPADGRHLYALTESGLLAFSRDPDTGALRQLDGALGCQVAPGSSGPRAATCATAPRRLGAARDAEASADGRTLFVANEAGGVVLLRRDPLSGALSAEAGPGCFGPLDSGCTTVRGYAYGTRIALTPDERMLVGPAGALTLGPGGVVNGGGAICIPTWPPGHCRPVAPADKADQNTVQDVAIPPDGRHAYVLTSSDTLVVLSLPGH